MTRPRKRTDKNDAHGDVSEIPAEKVKNAINVNIYGNVGNLMARST